MAKDQEISLGGLMAALGQETQDPVQSGDVDVDTSGLKKAQRYPGVKSERRERRLARNALFPKEIGPEHAVESYGSSGEKIRVEKIRENFFSYFVNDQEMGRFAARVVILKLREAGAKAQKDPATKENVPQILEKMPEGEIQSFLGTDKHGEHRILVLRKSGQYIISLPESSIVLPPVPFGHIKARAETDNWQTAQIPFSAEEEKAIRETLASPDPVTPASSKADPDTVLDDASRLENKKRFDDITAGESLLFKNEEGKIVSVEPEKDGYSVFTKGEKMIKAKSTDELVEMAQKGKWQIILAQKKDLNAPLDPALAAATSGPDPVKAPPQQSTGEQDSQKDVEDYPFEDPKVAKEKVIPVDASWLPVGTEKRKFFDPDFPTSWIEMRKLGDNQYVFRYWGEGEDRPLKGPMSEEDACIHLAKTGWKPGEIEVEEEELPVVETLELSLGVLEDILTEHLNEKFEVKKLKVEPTTDGAKLYVEMKTGFIGKKMVEGVIENTSRQITVQEKGLKITAGKKDKVRITSTLSELGSFVKKYVAELYKNTENPVSLVHMEGGKLVIGFAQAFSPEDLELLIGEGTIKALANVIREAREEYDAKWAETNDPIDPKKEEEWEQDAFPVFKDLIREEIASLGFQEETQEKIFKNVLERARK